MLKERTVLTRLVMDVVDEALESSGDIDYDEMVSRVEQRAPGMGLLQFSTDQLLDHADFVIKQVCKIFRQRLRSPIAYFNSNFYLQIWDYDQVGDEDESRQLMKVSALKRLANDAGVVLRKKRRAVLAFASVLRDRRKKSSKKKLPQSRATTTPLVRAVFESFFKDKVIHMLIFNANHIFLRRPFYAFAQIDKAAKGDAALRCGVCDNCQKPECGSCTTCRKMDKFTGAMTQRGAMVRSKLVRVRVRIPVQFNFAFKKN